ncbi:hypothetical protein AAFF_G00273010 [Aldrovandia affinis]|uniref:Uncharacterized protein n=1 Tax=Aldrovandia affinis TaxID=143900 RepID=A0AAD7WT71_9TELE|nr:hypothetical protein AAFF_G00273010 [Aldrovandia affinis]
MHISQNDTRTPLEQGRLPCDPGCGQGKWAWASNRACGEVTFMGRLESPLHPDVRARTAPALDERGDGAATSEGDERDTTGGLDDEASLCSQTQRYTANAALHQDSPA